MHRDYFRQAQKRRYQSRNYRNPHLDHKKPARWRLIGASAGGLVVILGLMTFLFAHPLFRIDRIEITGVEYIPRTELESLVASYTNESALLVFTRRNSFLFSDDVLARRLEETFALSSISVTLQEGTILIDLKERTSNLFWKTQDRLFVVDLEGIVVREITDPEDSMLKQPNLEELPVFVDANDVDVRVGSSVLTPEEIENAFKFFTSLEGAGIAYTSLEIDRLAGKWVQLVTQTGYRILFDPTGDIDEQFHNLAAVLQEQVEDPAGLEYIDLRFGDKVYFK